TVCHDGQGRATTRFYAHAETAENGGRNVDFYTHFWECPLFRGSEMEANCRGCHLQETDLKSQVQCAVTAECAPANRRAELTGQVAAQMSIISAYSTEAVYKNLVGTALVIGYQKDPGTSIITANVVF